MQLALPGWECGCSGLCSVQACCVLLMSWIATAFCRLSWASVLSPFVTSSSVNPQFTSMFPTLLFQLFLHALQQVAVERVGDKTVKPIWGIQSLELQKQNHLRPELQERKWKQSNEQTDAVQDSLSVQLFFIHILSSLCCVWRSRGLMETGSSYFSEVFDCLADAETYMYLSVPQDLSIVAWKVVERSCKDSFS